MYSMTILKSYFVGTINSHSVLEQILKCKINA